MSKIVIFLRRCKELANFLRNKDRPLHLYCGPSGLVKNESEFKQKDCEFYKRIDSAKDVQSDLVVLDRITSPLNGLSMNWNKFSHGPEVLITGGRRKDTHDFITIPASMFPIEIDVNGDKFVFSIEHFPEWDNYSHCQIKTEKNGKPISHYMDVKPKVRTEFRMVFIDAWNNAGYKPKLG